MKKLWMLMLLAAVLCLPAAHAAEPLASVRITPTGLEWQPNASYEGMALAVIGPDGLFLRREFKAGVAPSLDLYGRDGKPLPDGDYNWELSATPQLDEETRSALAGARKTGDDSVVWRLRAEGKLPRYPLAQSGVFSVSGGAIVPNDLDEARKGAAVPTVRSKALTPTIAEDQVIPDDLIVQGSGCFGFDCVNNESFGFDTIRLKENNLRIKFEDTSVGSFPTNDWQLTANDSASGGASKFSIEDITGAKVPFTVTAGASTNSIFVDSTGRVGFRTSTPVLDLHVATSNTPAMRLEQNNSGGFTAQTWDIAGNEANFFVRDVTGGSRLPFRIRPGAPTSSIDISADGDVGVGTASPDNKLDVECDAANLACIKVTNLNAAGFSGFSLFDGALEAFFFGTDVSGNSNRLNSINSYPLVIMTNSTERIRFPAPGGNYITAANGASLTNAGQWLDASSRDLKQNIQDLSSAEAAETLRELNPVKYAYKAAPDEIQAGFIAEDVPELVADKSHKALSSMEIVAVLTKVVQEQQKTIEKLSAKVEELEKTKQ